LDDVDLIRDLLENDLCRRLAGENELIIESVSQRISESFKSSASMTGESLVSSGELQTDGAGVPIKNPPELGGLAGTTGSPDTNDGPSSLSQSPTDMDAAASSLGAGGRWIRDVVVDVGGCTFLV
jgi:hypothetical protein